MPRPLPARSSIALDENSFVITAANSLGGITLPDSSRVMIGSSTRVQLISFNRANIASAQFFVVGKVR